METKERHVSVVEEEPFPRDATIEEIQTLVHEVEQVPITAWLLAFTGAASQLARFGITVAWQNYLQNPRGNPLLPGALGLGQAKATIIQNAFLFFQYLTPLPFALISDGWIGRYKTMLLCLGLLVAGYIVLVATSIPSALEHGAGVAGLAVTMVLIGLGQGGLSAVMMVNIAALSSIPTTLMEKHIDFWAAYLLPTCILVVSIVPVLTYHKRLVKPPPQGNVIPHVGQVLVIAWRSRFQLSSAYPEYQQSHHGRAVPWSASFVDEIRRGLKGCRVITCFVVFWLCYNQTTNNIISQVGQMKQQGVSNDTIQALNPIACIIMAPLIQGVIFPYLRHRHVSFGPILRMTVAFLFISAAIAAALGIALGPVSKDPKLVIMYASLAGIAALSAVLFYAVFRKCDAIYENQDAENARDEEGLGELVGQIDAEAERGSTPKS
ncbi:hypothetical protein F4805DRAFT_474895 [Annulohypoxylon moriforme]|nr:hypothetical protein F4805DRAFT_474895 [Annulohypoxylon moriforme]